VLKSLLEVTPCRNARGVIIIQDEAFAVRRPKPFTAESAEGAEHTK